MNERIQLLLTIPIKDYEQLLKTIEYQAGQIKEGEAEKMDNEGQKGKSSKNLHRLRDIVHYLQFPYIKISLAALLLLGIYMVLILIPANRVGLWGQSLLNLNKKYVEPLLYRDIHSDFITSWYRNLIFHPDELDPKPFEYLQRI